VKDDDLIRLGRLVGRALRPLQDELAELRAELQKLRSRLDGNDDTARVWLDKRR